MTETGWPVLMSASRKDFVGETLGADVEDRLAGTLAVTALGAWLGARIFRAHDVRETKQALDMVAAIKGDHAGLFVSDEVTNKTERRGSPSHPA